MHPPERPDLSEYLLFALRTSLVEVSDQTGGPICYAKVSSYILNMAFYTSTLISFIIQLPTSHLS